LGGGAQDGRAGEANLSCSNLLILHYQTAYQFQ